MGVVMPGMVGVIGQGALLLYPPPPPPPVELALECFLPPLS